MKLETLTMNGKVYDSFPASPDSLPNNLPNPYPLTINGKSYDGSEAVDLVITGGTTGENTSLGQTPVTLSKSANIKLVGEGEHSYTIKGKTIADLTTAEIGYNNATMIEHEHYIEFSAVGDGEYLSYYVTLSFSGLTVGEKYLLIIPGLGLDTSNKISNGYYHVKNSNNATLGTIDQDAGKPNSLEFTADTSEITVRCHPAKSYYWDLGYRTAYVSDIYINKASDGTERTGVINESGTFTDSYSLGKLPKGVTITSDPSCEVYSVSVGSFPGGANATLAGKTVVCFGDSMFGMYTGDNSAPAFVAQKTGATVHNVGFSGCRMSEHPYESHNPFSMYALADAIANGDWSLQDANAASGSANFPDQLAILKGIDFSAVDYIVIHYGSNDFTAGEGMEIDNASSPKATNTLCGALRYSVETLLTAFPKLKIFVSLPAFRYWTADDGTITYSDEKKNVKGNTLPEFVQALAETAKEYHLPVIDCYYGLGINKSNASTFLADGAHHNIEGRRLFGEYIGAKLIANGDAFHGTVSADSFHISDEQIAEALENYLKDNPITSGASIFYSSLSFEYDSGSMLSLFDCDKKEIRRNGREVQVGDLIIFRNLSLGIVEKLTSTHASGSLYASLKGEPGSGGGLDATIEGETLVFAESSTATIENETLIL